MTLKSGIFSLLAKFVFLGTSPGRVQVYHSCLKEYFSNSTQSLDKYFLNINHHFTEAYKGHCVLCKDVLSFVSQTFEFQVSCFGFCVLCPVLLIELVAQPCC